MTLHIARRKSPSLQNTRKDKAIDRARVSGIDYLIRQRAIGDVRASRRIHTQRKQEREPQPPSGARPTFA